MQYILHGNIGFLNLELDCRNTVFEYNVLSRVHAKQVIMKFMNLGFSGTGNQVTVWNRNKGNNSMTILDVLGEMATML